MTCGNGDLDFFSVGIEVLFATRAGFVRSYSVCRTRCGAFFDPFAVSMPERFQNEAFDFFHIFVPKGKTTTAKVKIYIPVFRTSRFDSLEVFRIVRGGDFQIRYNVVILVEFQFAIAAGVVSFRTVRRTGCGNFVNPFAICVSRSRYNQRIENVVFCVKFQFAIFTALMRLYAVFGCRCGNFRQERRIGMSRRGNNRVRNEFSVGVKKLTTMRAAERIFNSVFGTGRFLPGNGIQRVRFRHGRIDDLSFVFVEFVMTDQAFVMPFRSISRTGGGNFGVPFAVRVVGFGNRQSRQFVFFIVKVFMTSRTLVMTFCPFLFACCGNFGQKRSVIMSR